MSFQFNPFTGNLDVVADLSGYVPYTGATADVNLGAYGLSNAQANIRATGLEDIETLRRAAAFDFVRYRRLAGTWTDVTAMVAITGGTATGDVLDGNGDTFVIGSSAKFTSVYIDISTAKSSGGTFVWEYSAGSGTWSTLTCTDGTALLTVDGAVTFSDPGASWVTDTLDSAGPYYFIRLRVTGGSFTTEPTVLLVVPYAPSLVEWFANKNDTTPSLMMNFQGGLALGYADPTSYRLRALGTGYFSSTVTASGFVGASTSAVNALTAVYYQAASSATAAAPIGFSGALRLSGTAWDVDGAASNINGFYFLAKPETGNTTRYRAVLQNYYLAGLVNDNELLSMDSDGELSVFSKDFGAEVFTNGGFSGTTGWTRDGDWNYTTDDYTFTYSTGSGTLTQASTDFDTAVKPNTWYKFSYVCGVSAPSTTLSWIGTEIAQAPVYFRQSTTEVTSFFKTNASPGDFVIYTTATATSGFRLDSVSLQEVIMGDAFVGDVKATQNIYLPSSFGDQTVGMIYKGADRFFHDYGVAGSIGGNLFIGKNAGSLTLSGTSAEGSVNLGLGTETLASLTTGAENVAIGFMALNGCTSGSLNLAFGGRALFYNTTGRFNVALGTLAMVNNLTGETNVAIGNYSLGDCTVGDRNIALGAYALYGCNGDDNIGVGSNTLNYLTSGTYCVAIGVNAGMDVNETEDSKTKIDTHAILIGCNACRDPSVSADTALENIIAIGKNAQVGADDSAVIGGTGVDAVNVGVGLSIPTCRMDLHQSSYVGALFSDINIARVKSDGTEIEIEFDDSVSVLIIDDFSALFYARASGEGAGTFTVISAGDYSSYYGTDPHDQNIYTYDANTWELLSTLTIHWDGSAFTDLNPPPTPITESQVLVRATLSNDQDAYPSLIGPKVVMSVGKNYGVDKIAIAELETVLVDADTDLNSTLAMRVSDSAGTLATPLTLDAIGAITTKLTAEPSATDGAFADFVGTSSANLTNNISTYTTEAGTVGYVKMEVNGSAVWMRTCTAPTA